MKKYLLGVVACAALGAQAEPLTCADALSCAKMWSNAQEAVRFVAMPPIRLLTADTIETMPPRIPGAMGMLVNKVPLTANSYQIRYEFSCFQSPSCDGDGSTETGGKLFESIVLHGVGGTQ